MAKRLVAIVGSYRKGGAIDTAVDAVLEGAKSQGAATSKIYLIDKKIEFCQNCRKCTQEEGEQAGRCCLDDEMASVLEEVQQADAVVLAAPVNCWNVTAIFRRFLERLVGAAYWPWGQKAPRMRSKAMPRRAALISSCAMPGFLLPLATGAPRALRGAAVCLGAKPVANLWLGFSANEPQPKHSEKTLTKARAIGMKLVSN